MCGYSADTLVTSEVSDVKKSSKISSDEKRGCERELQKFCIIAAFSTIGRLIVL